MEKIKYTVQYFHDQLPEWKRKKDPITSRYFYRPLSFYGACFCARLGIDANTVSYISCVVAVMASALFIAQNHVCNIIASVLVNVWLWMDCIDGNLARCVKKQPFGEYADALAGYMLLSFLFFSMGWAAYGEGGLFLEAGNPWIFFIGALTSIWDPLMRLIYQKYNAEQMGLVERGVMPNETNIVRDHSQIGNWKITVRQLVGIGGLLPLIILLCAIFKVLDLAILFGFICNLLTFVYSLLSYTRKAIMNSYKYQDEFEKKINNSKSS